jgi:predicted alpha/beta superfamily hydrolase
MFDGHNVFFDADATYGKSWGMKKYMDRTRTDIIIAAVECNHDPDNGRLKEYSPYDFHDRRFGDIEGLGDITMQWLVHSFKPMIDDRFRTMPERENTAIAGSSMGGLMSLYAVLQYNEYFSRAAALSPSIWVDSRALHQLIRTASLDPDTLVYLDYGSRELGNHSRMVKEFGQISAELMARRIGVESRIIPGGEHCEASWERQIPYFMDAITYEG